MPRPNRPHWHEHSGRYRCRIGGKAIYFPLSIGRNDRPMRDNIPLRAWEHLDHLLKEGQARVVAESDPTVYGLAQSYIAWVEKESEAGRIVAGQLRSHTVHLSSFLEHSGLQDVRARLVSADQMDDFFDRFRASDLPRTGAPPSNHYVHNVGRSIRAMFRWASRPVKGREPSRLVHPNPLDGYKFPSQPGAVRGYVEGDVIRRFLRWAWARARREPVGSLKRRFDRIFGLMLRFERMTGCRPGEATGLEWSEIIPPPPEDGLRWEPKTIVVRQEKVKTRKQTTRARKIHVTPPVARLLRALERLPGRHKTHVFTHMRGTGADSRGQTDPVAGEPWPDGSAASKKVAKLREAAIAERIAGVESVGARKLIAYANRHAYASEGGSLGYSDEQIAEQLGNTPEVLRRIYSHSIDKAAAVRADEIAERRRRVVDKKVKPPGGDGG